jgi:ectoine hydroxylase-related dioxygenase (phytanoyl-CoA dioxygenase family)
MTGSDVNTYGVKEFTSSGSADDLRLEEITRNGYTILTDVLSEACLNSITQKLDSLYKIQAAEAGGEANLAAIGDAHTVRCPLAYDEEFLGVASHPRVLSLVERLLGNYFVLMLQNGIRNVPNDGAQQNVGSWHRDLNYQHFVSSRPLSISALFCVDEFSEETGGTYVLPGSHKTEAFPSIGYTRVHQTGISARAGSVLIFDSMLYHRGGHNRSQRVRRAINHMYTLPIIKQQISLPQMLAGRYRDDPFMEKFLGYASEPDPNVQEFRRSRLARLRHRDGAPADAAA